MSALTPFSLLNNERIANGFFTQNYKPMVTDLYCKCSLVGVVQVICLWLWKLRRLPGLTSLFEEGLAGAGCPGLSPVGFENLHWWSLHSHSGQCHCLVTLTVYSFFSVFKQNFLYFFWCLSYLVPSLGFTETVWFCLCNSHPPQSDIFARSLNRPKSWSHHSELSIQICSLAPETSRRMLLTDF